MTETNNLGFIENLAAQIDYSDGSTVSKTVMRAEGVNIVLFSFAAGEELSEHTAAMPVIVEALEGQLEITAEGRTVTLNPGGIVHFTTRLPHAVRAVEASKMALYMITACLWADQLVEALLSRDTGSDEYSPVWRPRC